MQPGDLVKVKDSCAYGGVYMQQIAGREALILSYQERHSEIDRMRYHILVGGKKYLAWGRDLKLINKEYTCKSDTKMI